MKYPDLEKRLRKLEKRMMIREGAVHVVFVRRGQSVEEEVAKLGEIGPNDSLITVRFVAPEDMRQAGSTSH